MDELRIRMFGGLTLEVNGEQLPPIASRTGRMLLAYLIGHRHTAPTRDLLAGRFWPDTTETQARRRLSHALWQIQSVLGEAGDLPDHIEATATTIRFVAGPKTWVDIDEFEDALRSVKAEGATELDPRPEMLKRLVAAVKLYTGDFLAGFYDDWILLEQERLRQALFSVLSHVVRLSKSWGDFDQALQYARRQALLDPLHEEAHREVMRLCYLLGRPNEALQQYERCASILATELGAAPDAETVALRDEIASGRQSPIVPFTQSARTQLFEADRAPLVGRSAERQEVVARMEDALAGRGGIVLVEGEPGAGKTRLLTACAEDANWRGLNVLWSTASPEGLGRPFDSLRQALNDGLTELRTRQLVERVDSVWLHALAPLLPSLQRWAPETSAGLSLRTGAEERDRIREALHRTFVALAQLTPTMLVLDDAHRADEDTLWALQGLADDLADTPLLICVSYRRGAMEGTPRWRAITQLDRAGRRSRLLLESLSTTETAELMRRLMSDGASADLVGRIQRETGGNPLFVLETLRSLHQHQVAEALKPSSETRGIDLTGLPISATVFDIVATRLGALPGDALHVARVLAISGTGLDLDSLSELCGMERLATLEAVDLLVSAGMVSGRGGRYSLSHEQLARVAYKSTPAGDRANLHGRLASHLERVGPADDAALGHHFRLAGAPDRAAHYLARAGDEARHVGAFAAARDRYRDALAEAEVSGWDARDRARLMLALELVLEVLGEVDERTRLLEDLTNEAVADRQITAESMRRRALLLGTTDDIANAERLAHRALEIDRTIGSKANEADDLLVLGKLAMWASNHPLAVERLGRALDMSAPESLGEAHVRHALSDALAEMSRLDEARDQLTAAEEIFARHDDRRGRAGVLGSLGVILGALGDEAQAEMTLTKAAELSEHIGYRYGSGINNLNLGIAYVVAGRVALAMAPAERSRAIFQSMGDHRGRALAEANLANLHMHLGDETSAARRAVSALRTFGALGHGPPSATCHGTLAELARRRGDATGALTHVERGLLEAAGASGTAARLQLQRTRAHIHLDTGELTEGLQVATAIRDEAVAAGQHWLLRDLAVPLARAHVLLGDGPSALAATADTDHCVQEADLLYWRMRAFELVADPASAFAALQAAHAALLRKLEGLGPDEAARSLDQVPLHRELGDAWRSMQPRTMPVRLAMAAAPTGRPLREHEIIELQWTPEHPLYAAIENGPPRRRHRLARLAAEAADAGAAPTIPDLAAALGVSDATVRRDLAALRATGRVVRTRGRR
jgi:DNA-binding SARP family transcriptional activator